jgi:hypothetical protein
MQHIRRRAPLAAACLCLAASGVVPAQSTSASRMFSVFDLQLNQPLKVRECNIEIVTVPVGKQGLLVKRTSQMYRYTEETPATGSCFKRGGGYGFDDPNVSGQLRTLPPPPPFSGGDAQIIYADDARPSLIGDKWVWVRVTDGVVTLVKFYFPALSIKDVRAALDAKYGKATGIDNLSFRQGSQPPLDYYVAKWELPQLTVGLTSVDTGLSYDGPRFSVGYAFVELGGRTAKADKNPL